MKKPRELEIRTLPNCEMGMHDFQFSQENELNGRVYWEFKCRNKGCIHTFTIDATDALEKTGRLKVI